MDKQQFSKRAVPLAPFGLDLSDPAFWDQGLSMIAGFIDELEEKED